MEQQIIGAVLGATSLFAGYVLNQLAQMRSQELSYLQHVPQFRDFSQLREHLEKSPSQRADVLVEGIAQKLDDQTLRSDSAGVEGAVKLVTTTTYTKVQQETENGSKWVDMSNTIENVRISIPFKLVDSRGNGVTVNSIHNAGGIRQILTQVWQVKVGPESRSLGDFATSMTLKEIPNGSFTREFLLVFGTSIGAYGSAALQASSSQNFGLGIFSSPDILFTPVEVDSSIRGLISRNEMIVNALKFFSMVFLIGGGSILLITAMPTILKMLGISGGRPGRRRRRLALGAREDSDIDSGNDSGDDL